MWKEKSKAENKLQDHQDSVVGAVAMTSDRLFQYERRASCSQFGERELPVVILGKESFL